MTFTNSDWQAAMVSLANNGNPNSQTTMSASAPVVIASDQTPVAIKGNAAAGATVPANPVYVGMQAFNNILRPLTSGAATNAVNIDTILAMLPFVLTNPSAFTADMLRHPAIFKTATATASGNTAVWTPTSGLKFRLMRFRIDLPANAAISGGGVIVDITFQDSATDMGLGISVFVPTTAVTTTMGGFTTGWVDLGNGKLSALANNVLNMNLSATLTTGKARVSVAGTEE